MSLFEFTSKTKSSVLQVDGENQIPINGFYLPVVIMPDNIKVDFRRLDNIDGLTKIKEINLNDDTVIINGVTFSGATAQDLYDSLEGLFFLDEGGGGSGSGVPITQKANQYSSLTPGTNVGELAYVENSEGTSWLPASLGGTYYPSGFYLWDGTVWVSDRNAIAKQLADNVLNISDNTAEIDQEVIDRASGDEGTVTIHSDVSNAGSGEIITTSERTVLSNQSGTNTGDETTSTIQTKRPLKTVNSESLEGTGNIEIESDFIPLPSEGAQNNERSIAILNSTGDDLDYTSDIKIDEASQQTFFKHGVQTNSAHEIVFRDSADQDQFIINKDKDPGYLQSLSGNDIKLNDYTIPETGDSFTLPSSDGTDGQVMTTDGSGNLSFEDISNGYTIFPIWAEDNSELENNSLEWSFGNGAKGANQLPIPIDCELFAVTFQCLNIALGSVTIDIINRNNAVSNVVATTNQFTTSEGETQIFSSPFSFAATDSLIFQTNTVVSNPVSARVCAWFRVKATSQSNSLLGELLDVSVPNPTVGDVLSYDGTDWGSVPGVTATIKTASFMSTVSQDVGTANNGIGTNIQINLTNVLGPNSLGYGLISGNITIPSAGWYKVSLKGLTETTTNSRQNTSFVVKRNSVDIFGTKVAGYNRNSSNNLASATLCPTLPQFQFSQGDTIGLYAISGGDNSQTSLTISQECILTLELI